ncbi:DegT/DnrJ/EryC1/StrS family aminotransferase [Thermodesulfobacteriota bacterium]
MIKKLALYGGPPVRPEPYPPYNTVTQKAREAAIRVLNSGVLSGFVATPGREFLGGEDILALEEDFCKMFGVGHSVSFNSASSALHASLAAGRVGAGDEVIVSPYTMSASATAAIICGAVPVFADLEPDYFCLEVEQVKASITDRTKAIMAVNIFGLPADLGPLRRIADEHNLLLVEDNAQAPAALYNGCFAGTIGHVGVFSLNRHKTIQCGEGGVAITNDPELAYRLQLIRNHGEVVQSLLPKGEQDPRHFDIIGYNYRLTELQAAIVRPQLAQLSDLNDHRIRLADYLTDRLRDYLFLTPPKIRPGCTHVYYLYPMLYRSDDLGVSRDLFVKALTAEGIPVSNYVEPLYRLPIYQNTSLAGQAEYNPEHFPVVEKLWQEKMIVTPICRPPLTEKDIDQFVAAVDKVANCAVELQQHED